MGWGGTTLNINHWQSRLQQMLCTLVKMLFQVPLSKEPSSSKHVKQHLLVDQQALEPQA